MLKLVVITLCILLLNSTSFAEKVVIIPLGKTTNIQASINWKGEWQDGADYLSGDAVQYQGSTYLCVQGHTSTPSDYPPHASWDLMAEGGATGPQGVQGIQGVKGDTGPIGSLENCIDPAEIETVSASLTTTPSRSTGLAGIAVFRPVSICFCSLHMQSFMGLPPQAR